ncbi:transcriptional regulator TbsP domain-containing protein [Candidatus Halobonum tyrrellensis]|uniref:Uncharacterized protein n=1 Tax=Candidatus Halobonum tyrrellensis G22 TaxID=1324957 RepID=V4HBH6_9EURY|nr:DUF5821 family protein [Candidatus Halobonum tyrrellensis]ESP88065.1 hypothetical protein K933_10964 [Candidatus Halobonum tyrrellensis G22]
MTTPPSTRDRPLAERLLRGGDPLVVGPPADLVRTLVDALYDSEASARLLLADATAAEAFAEFLTASGAAETVADGRLELRTLAGLDESLTVGAGAAYAHVRVGDRIETVTVADGETVDAVRRANEERWAAGAPFPLDAPPRSRLVDSLRAERPDAGATLAGALDAVETLRGDDPLDPVLLCTLVGARHGMLSMDLGEWAGDVDFSSRTEIARAKNRLVDAGLVETQRVPQGVGRPRQRLVLAADALTELPPAEFVAAARARLAGEDHVDAGSERRG